MLPASIRPNARVRSLGPIQNMHHLCAIPPALQSLSGEWAPRVVLLNYDWLWAVRPTRAHAYLIASWVEMLPSIPNLPPGTNALRARTHSLHGDVPGGMLWSDVCSAQPIHHHHHIKLVGRGHRRRIQAAAAETFEQTPVRRMA